MKKSIWLFHMPMNIQVLFPILSASDMQHTRIDSLKLDAAPISISTRTYSDTIDVSHIVLRDGLPKNSAT